MSDVIVPSEIEHTLSMFTGSEELHRWSSLFKNMAMTDGAQYLAEACGAYWLMDVIASWQTKRKVRTEEFQVWTLKAKNSKGSVKCDDGNGNILARQSIPYTDFPLDEVKLYATWADNQMIIMLPSEY